MRVFVRLGRAGRLLLLGGVLAASLARNAAAQTSTGSIRGYVTDSSGAPLEGARVVAVEWDAARSHDAESWILRDARPHAWRV